MKLMTKELEARFKKVGRQGKVKDPVVIAKFFTAGSHWTWYATEYNPQDRCFFGWVNGMEQEWGYFGLDELQEVKGRFGMKIERDLYCGEQKMSEVQAGIAVLNDVAAAFRKAADEMGGAA